MNKTKFISDMKEENGKTVKENNMNSFHSIPLGSLVEISETGERLFVCEHIRDCDGTPLYAVCSKKCLERYGTHKGYIEDLQNPAESVDFNLLHKNFRNIVTRINSSYDHGFSEESLSLIK